MTVRAFPYPTLQDTIATAVREALPAILAQVAIRLAFARPGVITTSHNETGSPLVVVRGGQECSPGPRTGRAGAAE